MITFENVSKLYPPDVHALHDVSFRIDPGEFVSVVGPSGSGKTTIAKLLFAEERPTRGNILIGDWNITRVKNDDLPLLRRQIGMIFQDFKLLPQKTAWENVAFALEVAGEGYRRVQEIVPQVLSLVGLHDKMQRYPKQLSGGEQQRVSIARALVHRPKIMLADEPTGNLDAITAREIVDLLRRINDFGTTVVMVTHDKDVVNMLGKRVVALADGKIVSDVAHGRYHI